MSRTVHVLALTGATVLHVALSPVAFALAVLSPAWFSVGGTGAGWVMALLSYSFLVAVIAAPFAAWAAFFMRRVKLAWAVAAAPVAWIAAFGVAYLFIAEL
ncbi:hypothetical protein [Caulobacter sp. 17J65-9]|uniref:hypothetical protein n=1 Tax=Caulobacter sp. 17J65-9 TaxID=2709382 RepID=UPI0013C6E0C9|nr:hypothetical protein [Caulobacter sp. 17J65-9]NEX92200.1 hypothetical protein [Caulobacter sp. 17J65-9]